MSAGPAVLQGCSTLQRLQHLQAGLEKQKGGALQASFGSPLSMQRQAVAWCCVIHAPGQSDHHAQLNWASAVFALQLRLGERGFCLPEGTHGAWEAARSFLRYAESAAAWPAA